MKTQSNSGLFSRHGSAVHSLRASWLIVAIATTLTTTLGCPLGDWGPEEADFIGDYPPNEDAGSQSDVGGDSVGFGPCPVYSGLNTVGQERVYTFVDDYYYAGTYSSTVASRTEDDDGVLVVVDEVIDATYETDNGLTAQYRQSRRVTHRCDGEGVGVVKSESWWTDTPDPEVWVNVYEGDRELVWSPTLGQTWTTEVTKERPDDPGELPTYSTFTYTVDEVDADISVPAGDFSSALLVTRSSENSELTTAFGSGVGPLYIDGVMALSSISGP